MQLCTCQNVAIHENLLKNGVHLCSIERSELYTEDDTFREAYDWLASALAKKVKKPNGATYPIWAYAETPEGYDYHGQGSEGEECVYLEIEVPSNQVVALDPVKWFSVVIDGFVYPSDADDEEYYRLRNWYENASEEEIEANRQQIFDVAEDEIPEMIFWSIKADEVKKAVRYTCHLDND